MSSARKPVIVRKFTRDGCAGYASPDPSGESSLEILDSSGKILHLEWSTVKWICYIRDLLSVDGSVSETAQPERLLRRKFTSRPRIGGLWLRVVFQDGDELEGIALNDRSLIDGAGILLTPPDTRSTTQRVFIPRTAIRELSVLAVIGTAAASRAVQGMQPELFPSEQVQTEEPALQPKGQTTIPLQS